MSKIEEPSAEELAVVRAAAQAGKQVAPAQRFSVKHLYYTR